VNLRITLAANFETCALVLYTLPIDRPLTRKENVPNVLLPNSSAAKSLPHGILIMPLLTMRGGGAEDVGLATDRSWV